MIKTFLDWLGVGSRDVRIPPPARIAPQVTGPRVVQAVVEAIGLDQSILLMGPRGCGKSWCVEQAIAEAMIRGYVPKNASIFLPGNREFSRDYLAEDELEFKLVSLANADSVVPKRRSAPLFTFAERDANGDFIVVDAGSPTRPGRPINLIWKSNGAEFGSAQRFALFLDEINRFSDGILDSLLSILEERKAVLAGKTYNIPVVVCMTMNPPGYDATAKNLSPPLAARISRTLRLSTPDLDTLSDAIIVSKLDKTLGDLWVTTATGGRADVVPMALIRRAALTTLCMWGSPNLERPGLHYMTPDTLSLLRNVQALNPTLNVLMNELGKMSQYGPDGRAAAEWVISALSLARAEARDQTERTKQDVSPIAQDHHLINTAINSLAQKTVDNFSAASRPDLSEKKEHLIKSLGEELLRNDSVAPFIDRDIDELSANVFKELQRFGCTPQQSQRCFWKSGASSNRASRCILKLITGDNSGLAELSSEDQDGIATCLQLLEDVATDKTRLLDIKTELKRHIDYFGDQRLRSFPFITDVVTAIQFQTYSKPFPRERVLIIADCLDTVWRMDGAKAYANGLSLLKNTLDADELKACKQLLLAVANGIELPDPPDEQGPLSRLMNRFGAVAVSQEEGILRERRKRITDISNAL